MNILLTGGAGYIGSHTAVVLLEAGFNIVIFDNLSNSNRLVLDRIEAITGLKPIFVKGDVRDTVLIEKTIKNYNIDAVIHFAGLKALNESIEKPVDYYENNVSGTICLIKAMQASNVKTLIFSSSATVYGNPKYLPIDEEHPTRVTNPYGRSKLQIEEILSDVARSENNWRIACLRYFNPVGAHQNGLIGENTNLTPSNLMPCIEAVAIGKKPKLIVFGNDYNTIDGTGVRDFIHITDLAEGHKASLDFLNNVNGFHTFNLGTGSGFSVLEMVEAFEKVSGITIPVQFNARRSGDVATCFAKTDKAKKYLKWQANKTIHDMCESAWNFQSKKILESDQFKLLGKKD
jgi:UDP-glucose 4-epimerase